MAKKNSSKHLHEARQRQGANQRQRWDRQRCARQTGQTSEKPEIDEQLADESIQWREAADRHRSNQKQQRCLWQRPGKPTHEVNLARVHCMDYRAGGVKQQ